MSKQAGSLTLVLALAAVLAACSGGTAANAVKVAAPATDNTQLSPAEAEVLELVAAGVEDRALARPDGVDGPLTASARRWAAYLGGGGAATPLSLRRALELTGTTDTFVFSAVAPSATFAESDALSDFLDRSATWTANRYGVASSGGVTVALSTFRTAELDPVVRSASVGDTLTLSGRVFEESPMLRLLMERDGMEGSTLEPVEVDSDGHFSAQLTVPDQKSLVVEVVGVGEAWGRSYAHIDVAIAGDPPTDFEDLGTSAPPTTGLAKWMREQINRARDRFGLSLLVDNPGLQALTELDGRDINCGLNPLRGFDSFEARLAKWGVTPIDAKMVRVEASERGELWAALWFDPALRGRILDTGVSHVGLSVSDHPSAESGKYTLLAYLTAPLVEHDPAMDVQAALAALNASRREAGTSPVVLDPALSVLVQRFAYPLMADREAATRAPKLVVDAARAAQIDFKYVYVDIAAAQSPEMLVFVSEMARSPWKKVGIATARGRFGGAESEPVVLALVIAVR